MQTENIDVASVVPIRDANSHSRSKSMRGSKIVSLARDFFANKDQEVFIVIDPDQTRKINSIHVVSRGSANQVMVHPREVFKNAILSGATNIVVAHNHPSGNPVPSNNDTEFTRRLIECGDLLGIKVLDHLIIGDSEYSYCVEFEEWHEKKGTQWTTKKFEDPSYKSRSPLMGPEASWICSRESTENNRGEAKKMTKNKKAQGDQEVFAYRIGEKLKCPACHDLNAKILAVHEIEPTPSKPLIKEDIKGFICDQCGLIRGDYKISSVQELRDLQEKLDLPDIPISQRPQTSEKPDDRRNLVDVKDELTRCISKVALLCDCFCPHRHEDELFSPDGLEGFRVILRGIEDDLNRIVDGVRAEDDLKRAGNRAANTVRPLQETIEAARLTGKI